MKKRMIAPVFLLLLMAALLTITATAAEIVDSGYCGGEGDGTNISWTLDSEGTLVISGIGRMLDYTYSGFSSSTPWYNSRNSITRVVLQNGIVYVGDNSFAGCNRMTSIIIPNSVTSTGYGTFQDCNSLTSIIIPNSITSIAPYMFVQCGQLTSVTIPDSVTSIQGFAFLNCSNLKDVTIPNSVRHIGNDAFGCCGLIKVTIPDGINEVSAWTFSDCFSLTSVTIPDSVVSIEDHAFDSTGLRDVYYGGSETQWNAITIGSNNIPLTSATIHYNSGNGTDSAVINFYPENGKVLNLDDPSKGTSATNYLDAKPRIFFDREVDSYAGRAKLDFSNGTLEIRQSSDDGLVYSVKESARNPGTSNQMPLWGEASPYTAVRLEDAVSTLDYETEYYVVMPEGFVKFSDGTTSSAIKKGDWTFQTEKVPTYRMVPMTKFGEPTIHYSGTASVWFRVEDENQNPVTDATIYYQLGDGKQESVHPDGNGLIPVVTPHIDKAQRFFVTFSAKRNNSRGVRSINILNSEQYFDVRVRELSYEQEWSGSLSGGVSVGLGADAGAKTGVVEAKASLIDASVSAGYKGTMSVSDAYDDGQRTLTMKASTTNDCGIKLEAGTKAQAIKGAKITVLGVSGEAKAANQLESGLKIEDYDPNNPDHALQIGTFVLASSLFNSRSVLANRIYSLLGVKIGNQSGNTNSLSVSGSADIVNVNFGMDDVNDISGSVGGVNASAVWSWKTSQDFVKDLTTRSKSLQAEMGGGLFSPKAGPNKDAERNLKTMLLQTNFNSYALGASLSASKEISATITSSGELDSVAYQTYIDGEKDIFWNTDSVDYYSDVVFQGARAKAIQDNNREIREFINGTNPFINIQQAIDDMRSSGQIGTIEETTTTKRGFDQNFPIGLSLGVELDFDAGLAGSHSYSYMDCSAVLYDETVYVTSVSDVTANLVKSQSVSFMDLLTGPIETAWNTIKNDVASVFDKVSNGVKNACATVSDTVSTWFVSVSSVPNATLQSYEIATLMSGSEPDTNVSVSATLGDAYSVTVFADNERENPVSDDQLADHPLTLTLEYTDAMLTAAGASPDAAVQIFYFDRARNLYVYESSSVQDKSQKTVTAQITKNGEYVLATDSASPLITDFHMDNQTLTPSFTVLVSDLSGLADFRFWIDNDTPLVTMRNLQDYYNSDTGVFAYSFSSALSEGRHTAYFLAKDVLGNANAEPISFPFEAHASQGMIVLTQFPTSAITGNQSFTVKATGTHMDTFNTVALRCNAGNQTLFTLPMVWQEDAWIVQVTPVQGVENLTITAVAEDAWGNTVTSESVTITMNLTENLSSVQIQNVTYHQDIAEVTVQAPEGFAAPAVLFAAIYRDGKQVCIGSTITGLASGELKTASIELPYFSEEATTMKVFALLSDGLIPLCPAFTLSL